MSRNESRQPSPSPTSPSPTSPSPSSPSPSSPSPSSPSPHFPRGHFDHQQLHVYHVAREALVVGEAMAKQLPLGYGKLKDQLRRALLSCYLGIAEGASRKGKDRQTRFLWARAEAGEAAAAVGAVSLLKLAPAEQADALTRLLARTCAMLKGLARR